jgi:DNA repair exonuclease SbcCD ATPase subunit
MKLILENFRCFSSITITIPSNGIILLNGPSGIGKSTIFKAIYYVLYNKEQKCISYGKKKCKVELHFQETIICRTKNPNVLTLIKNGITYQDTAAQGIINKDFGINFCLTSYIAQKNIEGFFQLSKDQKTSFLQQLIFNEYSIEQLKCSIKNEMKSQKELLIKYTSNIELMNKLMPKFDIKYKPLLSEELQKYINIDDFIKINIESSNNVYTKLQELQQLQKTSIKQIQQKEHIEISLLEIQTSLNKFSKLMSSLYLDESAKTNSIKLKETLQVLLLRKKECIDNEKNKSIVQQNKLRLLDVEKNIQEIDIKINQIKIEYDKQMLQTYKLFLEEYKCSSIQSFKDYYKKYESFVNSKYKEYINQKEKYDQIIEENKNIQEQINKLQSGKSLICPSCNQHLLLTNDKLVIDSEKNSEKLLSLLKSKIVKEDKTVYLHSEKEYNQYKLKCSKLNNSILLQATIDLTLEEIEDYLLDHEQLIKYQQEKQSLLTFKDKLEADISSIKIKELTFNLVDLEKDIENIQYYIKEVDKYNQLVKEKKQLEDIYTINYTEDIENYSNKYTLLKEEEINLMKYKQEIINHKKQVSEYNEYCKFINEFEEAKEIETKQLKECSTLELFLSKVIQSESMTLEQVISTINLELDVYMQRFFHSSLTMILSSTKTNTDGDKKYIIDVQLYDEENNCITIDNLSGGEYDRCSLALFLTFNKISNSSILLLDECLSSLHMDSVIDIIDTIKETMKDKLVIVTLHQANIGIFDDVINIESLREQ